MKPIFLATVFVSVLCLSAAGSGEKKDEKPAFDPKSPANTLRWIVGLWQPIIDDRSGNELAKEKRQKAMDAALAKATGAEIDWVLSVSTVRKAGITFRGISVEGKAPKVDKSVPLPPPPPNNIRPYLRFQCRCER